MDVAIYQDHPNAKAIGASERGVFSYGLGTVWYPYST